MPIWKRILVTGGIALGLIVLLNVAFHFIFLDLFVDLWWFQSLEFERYFWLRQLYRYFISGGVTLLFFLIFFSNFWIASNFLGLSVSSRGDDAGKLKSLLYKFQSGALDVYFLLSLVLAVFVALPFYHEWEAALLYFLAPRTGIEDTFFQYDASFYLFSVPVYELIQKELLSGFSILFISVAFLYWLEHRILAARGEGYPHGVKIHLTALVLAVCLLVGWGFMLQRFGLLYVSDHEPVFFGPGFVEANYHLPLIWSALLCFLGASLSAIFLIHTHGRAGKWPLCGFLVLFLLALGMRNVSIIPNMLTRFVVRPNPVTTEKQYMQNNIDATLAAYKLSDVKTIDFEVSGAPEDDLKQWVNQQHVHNIPVWDRHLLDDVYNQLQGIRPYYKFSDVDEDRYAVNGSPHQVNLSAREINIDKLPEAAHTWENIHLRYTTGYGAVMTPAGQEGDRPIDWYLSDLDLQSRVGFNLQNPDIYYGMGKHDYAIVPNKLNVADISSGGGPKSSSHEHNGGIPIQSLFRKLLLAVYLKDENIFLSTNLTPQSRMLIRRNIRERIETLTPYLALDSDPYLVVTRKNLFWIQDAYTVSDKYPASKSLDVQFPRASGMIDARINYIRNSIKVVVNANSGDLDYYLVDPKDPIVMAYQKAYPGLFRSLDEMPGDLKSHLRYPRDLFYYQLQIYSKYHQTNPDLFYQQAETWDFPKTESKPVLPYFITTEIEGCPDLPRFILAEPMTPIKRDNLSVLAIAGALDFESCGTAYSGTIAVYKFRKDVQVAGPAQVYAQIHQDPKIAELFTLWDQHGSKVNLGRMVVMPLEHSVLYVQPVYLISTSTSIPELTRIIVSIGNEVVMENSLEIGFQRLEEKLRGYNQPMLDANPEPESTQTGDAVEIPPVAQPIEPESGKSVEIPRLPENASDLSSPVEPR